MGLSKKWGKAGAATEAQVAAEEERFQCADTGSMAGNIWTGAAATVREARPSRPEKETPVHEMNRNDLKNAVLGTKSKTGFDVEGTVVDGPRQRRARIITDASALGEGMGSARHF